MSKPNQSDPQNDYLNRLSKITHDIVKESASGEYIYRGEPEHYEEKYNKRVSSTLYRVHPEGFDSGKYNLTDVQEEIVKEARGYIHEQEKDDFEILTELQHYGSQTNLIDFTTDYYIALFFACDGSHDKDGRIILLPKTEGIKEKYRVKEPQHPQNRVIVQKSIFVQPPDGFIDPNDIITISIPANLKQWILIHLRKFQDISTQTIYNDLHGFIRHRNLRFSSQAVFLLAMADRIREDIQADSQTTEERQNQFQMVIELYTTGIQYSPYEVTTYMKQGKCYHEIGNFDLAIETFSKPILLEPSYVAAYINRGIAYHSKGDYSWAIADYTKAIDLGPDNAEAYYYRGYAYSDRGEIDLAIEDYNKTIDLNPDHADAYNNRGVIRTKKDDFDRATEDFTKAIDLKPSYAEAYNNRGGAYLIKGNYEGAIEDYTTAIKLKPDAQQYNNRGYAYSARGAIDHALKDFTKAIEMIPDYEIAYHNRGNAYSNKGDVDRAIEDYNKVIELNPNYAEAYCNRGKARLHLKEWESAKSDLTTAKDMGADIIASFQNDYENVSAFESKHGIQLPPDIAAMLSEQS